MLKRLTTRFLRNLYALAVSHRSLIFVRQELELFFRKIYSMTGYFIAFDSKIMLNQKSESMMFSYSPDNDFSELCIVIQGPIGSHREFVKESISLYLRELPGVTIVLSTWKGDEYNFEFIEHEDTIKLIFTDLPKNVGFSNVNCQIISTKAGLAVADEMKKKISVKSRTDQRFTNFRTIKELYKDFLRDEPYVRNRILILSLNTFLLRIFGASDMFQVGHTRSLIKFWNVSLDTRSKEEIEEKIKSNLTIREYAELLICETYLTFSYVKRIRNSAEFTFGEWLKSLADDFIVLDRREVGLLWAKYSHDYARWEPTGSFFHLYEVSTLDWIRIKERASSYEDYEELLSLEA